MRFRVGPIFAVLLTAVSAVFAAPAGQRPIAIVHATLIDGKGGTPIPEGTVVVRDGLIEAVGPASAISVPRDARVVEGRGKSVLPGFADLHVHLTGGWDGSNNDFLSYQRYLDAFLYAGVTTVLDVGNSQPLVLQLRQEVAAGRIRGPRIYCAGAMVDGADPAWPDLAYPLVSASQVPVIVQRDRKAGVDIIKGYSGLSFRMLQRLSDEASKAGLRVVVDQWSLNGSPDVARAGISGFAHLPTRPMSVDDIRVLKDRSLFLITTLVVNESAARTRMQDLDYLREPLIADTTPAWLLDDLRAWLRRPLSDREKQDVESGPAELAESLKNAKKLLDAGLLLVAGTDAPYPGLFQGEGLHREMELLVQAGWTPLQAIRSATYDAARVMNAAALWGSLEPGRRADLLLVGGRPDQRISDTRKIEMVMREGVILDRGALKFDPARGPNFRPVPGIFYDYGSE